MFRMRGLFAALLLTIATPAYALGEEIYYLVGGEAVLLVIVIVTMNLVNFISFEKKVLVFASYVIGAAISLFATNNLPYGRNIVLINVLCLITPAITWLSALWLVCRSRKKNITVRSRGDA